MRHNLRFILLLIKLKLSHMIVFRLSFLGGFLADGMMFMIQLLTFNLIYSQVDAIGGWTHGQMTVFIGTFSLINGLSMLLFFFGVNQIPGKIREGALDYYITKPINPLLRLSFEHVNPGSVLLLLLSGGIVARGLSIVRHERSLGMLENSGAVVATVPLVIAYCILVLLMTLLLYDMNLIIRTLPFFFFTIGAIERLEGNMLDLNFKVPGVLYKGILKVLFYFVLPYGIMATIPTQVITQTATPLGILLSVFVVAIFTAFALWFWKFGLKHYKSASS